MREQIIQSAITLYAQYGIKGVTMDQITKQLGISKKTLYEKFENKDQLVNEVIDLRNERVVSMIEGIEDDVKSSLEAVLLISTNVYTYLHSFCPAFYRNAQNFPKAHNALENEREYLIERLTYYFQHGVEEGAFLERNYDVVSEVYVKQLKDTIPQYQWTTMLTFLRGVCTETGQKELQHYVNSANQFNQLNINQKNMYK